MEKSTPHGRLNVVHALLAQGKVRLTFAAVAGGAALGLDEAGIVSVVKRLRPGDFFKSMTSYADHKVWHDVYKPRTAVGEVYVKLVVVDDVLVVSFKEL